MSSKDDQDLEPFPRIRIGTLDIQKDEERMRNRTGSKLLLRRVSRAVIQMRCTNMALVSFSLLAGCMGIALQMLSLSSEQWLETVEPRPVNKTTNRADNMEVRFQYHSGFWRVCRNRLPDFNETFTLPRDILEYFATSDEFHLKCLRNEFFSANTGIEGISGATAAIMTEIQIVAFIYIISLATQTVATVLSLIGHLKDDKRTLYGGILYISAGLCTAISILKYICVVDEEMSPRMKPTSEGEPSKYDYAYGYSFLGGALSFLVIQLSAVCQLTLYFRRFPELEDKMKLIPGLREKVRQAQIERELGIPSPEHKIGQLSAHSSPRRSFSTSPCLGRREGGDMSKSGSAYSDAYTYSTPLFTSTYGFDGGYCSEKSYVV